MHKHLKSTIKQLLEEFPDANGATLGTLPQTVHISTDNIQEGENSDNANFKIKREVDPAEIDEFINIWDFRNCAFWAPMIAMKLNELGFNSWSIILKPVILIEFVVKLWFLRYVP